MASSQKKKEPNKRSKSSRKNEPAAVPSSGHRWARYIVAALFLLMALCVLVSPVGTDAFFLTFFAKLLRGLFGSGYWICGAALILAGVNLLRHRDDPVVFRTVCALVLPLLIGALVHP